MLLTSHLTHPKIKEIFSDTAMIQKWIDVELALARVQAKLDVIPQDAAEQISADMLTFQPNEAALEVAMEKSGVPIAALVKQMRTHVGGSAGDFIHFGATTQDIMDTAFAMQINDALSHVIVPLLNQIVHNLSQMADAHRSTVMAARTHSQQALPTTFGLKAANWMAPLLRQFGRLYAGQLMPPVQFGGAAGTLAALGTHGLEIQSLLAQELGLDYESNVSVWHSQRDGVAQFANWLSITTGMLAKMGQDIVLMAQSEIAEVRESADLSRGGSSTMPQKSNPMVSEALIAIHRTNAGLLGNIHQALIHEHERATGSWQVEWLSLPHMISLTAAALEKAAWLSENLVVNVEKIRQNVMASNGLMLAEAASFVLAEHMPRVEAKTVVRDAVQIVLAENTHLVDVLSQRVDLPIDWAALREEKNYLGMTHQLIDNVLNDAAQV
ncbi:MAG: adenylosuccinate lyase family protein [Chloroflexota bacterium]